MKIMIEPGLEKVPILIIANKTDLEEAVPEDEILKTIGIGSMDRKDIVHNSCSAKTGEGVWESLAKLADLMNMLIK